ncbi:bacillithiol biosynthesis deacetylase BshB1 [bacterium]|nr:bacillithiol biosynthesis deacetylase BshB1 [bacterium]
MSDTPKLDILAIAAHPDDIEITCGGLLIKYARLGKKTGALDLTRGEMGTKGDEHDRQRELAKAAEIMGLAYRHNLEMPDSAVEFTQENKYLIAQAIRDTRPELVILPHWVQRHPDHLACSRLGYDACFLAGLKKAPLAGDPHRPKKIFYVSYFRNTDYSFLVDISDEMRQKLEAVAAYTSQFGSTLSIDDLLKMGADELHARSQRERTDIFHPGVIIYDLMLTRSRALGQMVGVRYAEAYTVKEQILIDDPLSMPVKSI